MKQNDFPIICDACITRLRWSIRDGGALGLHYCKHNQVLASVEASAGRFVRWVLQGPLTEDEAQVIVSTTSELVEKIYCKNKNAH